MNKSKIVWYKSLQFRLILVFFVALVLSTPLSVWIVKNKVNEQALANSKALTIQKGQAVVNRLGQQITYIEGIANSLAGVAGAVANDPETIRQLLPVLLKEGSEDSIIAGGGLWPEPFAFDPKRERASFFWGREADGTLTLYDDYNDPDGNGYHNEEWYVPASHHSEGSAYWSQSYMDPFSREPMVTCTFPYFRNGLFRGVVTVDVKLDGLYAMFAKEAEAFGGYIFAVDRNTRFLSFPNKQLARLDGSTDSPQTLSYITAHQLSLELPQYKSISEELDRVHDQFISDGIDSTKLNLLATELAESSYQISEAYAALVAGEILAQRAGLSNDRQQVNIEIDNDPILNSASFHSLFLVPSANWKLVVVAPMEAITIPTREFADGLFLPLVLRSVIGVLIVMFTVQLILVNPIKRVARQISQINPSQLEDEIDAGENRQNELGHLIASFNLLAKDLIRTRQRAEVALDAKRSFVANISHELRTPLNGIMGMLSLLKDHPRSAEQEELIEDAESSSQHLLKVIDEILDFSKIEADAITLECIPFNLRDLASTCQNLISFKLRTGVKLSIHINDQVPTDLHSDPYRLKQILLNLLSNAAKFTHKGLICLRIEMEEMNQAGTPKIRFSVIDSGIGIPKETIEQLFEEFHQADTSTTREYGGTGLGLSISSRLVQLLGGQLEVKSTLDEGSTFHFDLKLETAEMKIGNIEPPSQNDITLVAETEKTRRILLVEDNPMNRKVTRMMLKRLGYSCDEVENGKEALENVDPFSYDLILMDCQMPVMDGYKATEAIRSKEPAQKHLPILALTANAMPGAKEACLDAGMNDVVTKPLSRQALAATIEKWMPPA